MYILIIVSSHLYCIWDDYFWLHIQTLITDNWNSHSQVTNLVENHSLRRQTLHTDHLGSNKVKLAMWNSFVGLFCPMSTDTGHLGKSLQIEKTSHISTKGFPGVRLHTKNEFPSNYRQSLKMTDFCSEGWHGWSVSPVKSHLAWQWRPVWWESKSSVQPLLNMHFHYENIIWLREKQCLTDWKKENNPQVIWLTV